MPLRNETRGGARKGAGRKRLDISEKEVRELVSAARKWARTNKKPFYARLVDIIQASEDDRTAVAAYKVYTAVVIAKESHETKEVHHYAPAILPVLEGDPSKIDESRLPPSVN